MSEKLVPLRKVLKRELRHVGSSMSNRGGLISVANHYHTSYSLECGHRVEVKGSSGPDVASKRCKKCVAQS